MVTGETKTIEHVAHRTTSPGASGASANGSVEVDPHTQQATCCGSTDRQWRQ